MRAKAIALLLLVAFAFYAFAQLAAATKHAVDTITAGIQSTELTR